MTKEFLSMRMENKYSGDINVDKSSSRESMDAYKDNWSACLLYRNKQLTRQLGDYQKVTALVGCSSSLMVAIGQLLCLHQNRLMELSGMRRSGIVCLLSLICFMEGVC